MEPDNPSLELTAAQLRGIVRHVRGALDGQSFLVEYDGDAGVDGHRITPVGGGRPFLIDGGGRTRSTSRRSQ